MDRAEDYSRPGGAVNEHGWDIRPAGSGLRTTPIGAQSQAKVPNVISPCPLVSLRVLPVPGRGDTFVIRQGVTN